MPSELKPCPVCKGSAPNCQWGGVPADCSLWGKNYTRTEPATPAGDDALVEELAQTIESCDHGIGDSIYTDIACAILPILLRREADAKNAGYSEGLFTGNCDGYDEGYAKGRAETIAGAIAAQPSTDYNVIRAYERGRMRGVADFVAALWAIERGQHERTKP